MDYRALILIAVVSATPAVAQTRVGPSVTFDATVGKGTGRTDGLYKDNRSGFAADAVLVMRIKSLPRGSLVAGVNGSVHGAGSHTDICLPAPDGRCIPAFPEFEMLGALLGWQDASAYLSACQPTAPASFSAPMTSSARTWTQSAFLDYAAARLRSE